MVVGQGSKDQGAARRMAYSQPKKFGAIIDAIIDATVVYLSGQIEAGVEAVQLFDSWAGSLAPLEFERWVIRPNRRRSEEHTSELQSLMRISYVVFCLKKKNTLNNPNTHLSITIHN